MKKILLLIFILNFGFSLNTVMPFFSYIDYSKAIKDKGYDVGIYYNLFKFPYSIEVSAEAVQITYKDNNPDYKEKDLTLIGNYFVGNNYKIKGGIRNIFVEEDNKYNQIFIVGILYYEYLKYNVGIDYYYSNYDNFYVNQITPHMGFDFGNYYSELGSYYFNININLINISNKDVAGSSKSTYINSDISLTNSHGKYFTTIKTSFGKNAYKVTNGGFVVYNLGEEYKNSFGLDIGYKIDNKNILKVGFSRNEFEEDNKKAYSNVYVITYSLSF